MLNALLASVGGSPAVLVYVGLAMFVAFMVRGFSGFGSSLIAMSSLTLVLPPAQVIPAVFALEIVASISLLPSVWRDVAWRSLTWVLAGTAVAMPVGIWVLIEAPADLMAFVVSIAVVVAALAMLAGWTAAQTPGPLATFAVGCASGLLNGACGFGGPPAILFYFATVTAIVGRATLIAFFMFIDFYALILAGAGGLLDGRAALLTVFSVPCMLLGIWVGNKGFVRTDPETFRRWVLWLVAALGLAGIASFVAKVI